MAETQTIKLTLVLEIEKPQLPFKLTDGGLKELMKQQLENREDCPVIRVDTCRVDFWDHLEPVGKDAQ